MLAAAIGFAALFLLVHHSDPKEVLEAILHAPLLFPVVVALQAFVVGLESWAVLLLYGERRHAIPFREVWRSSMFSFAVVVVFPFGRAVGEAARATMVAKYVGSPLAAAAAGQIQAATLFGNAIISIPCLFAVYALVGVGWLFWAIVGHLVLSAGLATGLVLAGRYAGLVKRLGRFFPGGEEWGSQVDQHLRTDPRHLIAPAMMVLLSRLVDTCQRAALLAAVGGAWGPAHSLASEGINLVAAAAGDAIPGQVGILEAGYSMAAGVLGVDKGAAVAMGLLFHLAVAVWVGFGFLAALLIAPAKDPVPAETTLTGT